MPAQADIHGLPSPVQPSRFTLVGVPQRPDLAPGGLAPAMVGELLALTPPDPKAVHLPRLAQLAPGSRVGWLTSFVMHYLSWPSVDARTCQSHFVVRLSPRDLVRNKLQKVPYRFLLGALSGRPAFRMMSR